MTAILVDVIVTHKSHLNQRKNIQICLQVISVEQPKPQRSGNRAKGRFGKQDFVYLPEADAYRCPAGETLTWRCHTVEHGKKKSVYWTMACAECRLKEQCTTGNLRRIKCWEHEAVLEASLRRLDLDPDNMAVRRYTANTPSARSNPGWAPSISSPGQGKGSMLR